MGKSSIAECMNMCMVYDEDRVLVLDKVDDDYIKGITFPGGHVDEGEAFVDAVIREVKEETGLDIFSPVLCGTKNWTNDDGTLGIVFLYKTDKFKGNLKSSNEGKVFWMNKSDFVKTEKSRDMDDLYKVFLDESLSEFHFYKSGDDWKYFLK